MTNLDQQLAQWRGYLAKRPAISSEDLAEMEDHLRSQIDDLETVGLTSDEAFLVAVKRMGSSDAVSREFAREHSDRLWKQLVLTGTDAGGSPGSNRREIAVVLGLAVAAALTVKLPMVLAQDLGDFYIRNIAIMILPFLAGYFCWKRALSPKVVVPLIAVPFGIAAALLNAYPFEHNGMTLPIAAMHASLALWFVVGVAYVGGRWRDSRRRMDFVRFTGEFLVYFQLLALGGGVLVGITVGSLEMLDLHISWLIEEWVVPCGAVGAVIVAAWLVEAKQNVIENILPVLTRIFTPLTAIMLVGLLGGFLTAGDFANVDRDFLILIDGILVLVLGLVLYGISARNASAAPDLFDRLQLVVIAAAMALDALGLAAMLTRIAEYGFTANKVVALGLNAVLLVNLAWALWLGLRFVRGRASFVLLEKWQTDYLPVLGGWAVVGAAIIPVAFGFN